MKSAQNSKSGLLTTANKTGCTVFHNQLMHMCMYIQTKYIMKKHAHKLHNLLKLTI